VLVAVTGFGSVWRHRPGRPANEGRRFAEPVYYNTSGVVVNGIVRQRPKICGYARFDCVGGFDPHHPSSALRRIFECAEPSIWMGWNKLLLRRIARSSGPPDAFLVVARSEITGWFPVGTESWRSTDTWVLSLSECKGQQEAMLLMPVGGWIETNLGRLALEQSGPHPWFAQLVLTGNG
jgi:hypothetical protein